MSTSLLVARCLSKRFGRREAVSAVSFEVQAGEVLGLLGPNGSGKSTILKMLVGCVRPTSGSASIAGYDISLQGRMARTNIGYVPENIPLYDHLRVVEFLRTMGELRGLSKVALQHSIGRVIEDLSLQSVRETLIAQLSRGFRQRVAIAQSLLAEPALLIFDEPTNGLDPRQIIECRKLIKSLAGNHAVLVTSHILSEIEKVANRAAILQDGRLLAIEDLSGASVDLESRFLALTASAQ